MKKNLLLLLLTASTSIVSQAQNYSLTHLDETYSELTAATNLNTNSWFYHSFEIPVPFEINILGDAIKNLSLSNGILYADSKNSDKIQYQLFAQSAEILDPGYEFNPGGPATPSESFLKYKVDGEPGNQILKIEVPNAANGNDYFDNELKVMRINFQIWFYESSDLIEYRYGGNTITNFDLFFNDYSVQGQQTPKLHIMIAKTAIVMNEFDQEESELIEVYSLSGSSENPVGKLSDEELGTLNTYPKDGTVYQFKNSNLGIDKNANRNISLYPNPTTDFLNISLDTNHNQIGYTIFDVLGKIIQTGVYQSNTSPIVVSNLNPGIYLIKIDQYKTLKFIKK